MLIVSIVSVPVFSIETVKVISSPTLYEVLPFTVFLRLNPNTSLSPFTLGVGVITGVFVMVGVTVTVTDGVTVMVTVPVGVGVSVNVGVGVKVIVGVGVSDNVGVTVTVTEGVTVGVGVTVKVGVGVSVFVGVGVSVLVGVGVSVLDGVGVVVLLGVGVVVLVGVGVAVLVGVEVGGVQILGPSPQLVPLLRKFPFLTSAIPHLYQALSEPSVAPGVFGSLIPDGGRGNPLL